MRRIIIFFIFTLIASVVCAKNDKNTKTVALGDTIYQHQTDSLMGLADRQFFKEGDFDMAFEYYWKAYRMGNVDAAYMLGRCYAEGLGTYSDMRRAITLWTQAGNAGSSDASLQMGQSYLIGLGVKKNIAQSAEWYRQASDQGSLEASHVLATMYFNGVGVEKSEDKAIELWTKAADGGYAESQEALGLEYLAGTNTKRNLLFAAKYLKMAADQGRTKAAYYAGLCCEKSYGLAGEDYVSAAYYYMVAADAEMPDAQYRLALLYSEGKGVDKNMDRANYWLQQAIKNGLKAPPSLP